MSQIEPLASLLRPQQAEDYVGQSHLLSPEKPLYQALHHGQLHSMILWGPPGSGKTTLARLLSQHNDGHFSGLSAVTAGVKEIKQLVEVATGYKHQGKSTLLFIDEIHRFTKSQQDYLLPHIESGLFVVIGATTENPSFSLNSALLSRCTVYVLKRLDQETLAQLTQTAFQRLTQLTQQSGARIEVADEASQLLIDAADGDARRLLNILELAWQLAQAEEGNGICINMECARNAIGNNWRQFDRQGDHFYDQISAMHKAMRGSDPDAALYWFCRMLDGGCDPRYLARRIVRMASEDVGNADPRALELSIAAADSYERLGTPEGELMLAQAIIYISATVKSNAVYKAFNQAMACVKNSPSHPVPIRFRNAATSLMKELDYGKDYQYAHDHPDGIVAGEHYFPDEMPAQQFYQPLERGVEARIKERLDRLRNEASKANE